MAATKQWIVTVAPGCPVRDIADALEAEGFSVAHVFDAIGSISGEAPEDAAERARALPGVADVSADEPIDIGPPDEPDVW